MYESKTDGRLGILLEFIILKYISFELNAI